ncbi:MAG TPA: hypothetical protein VF333_02370 [Pyrinomonadaceae bacterium]
MNRSSLALLILLVVTVVAHGQSVARAKQSPTVVAAVETNDDQVLAARAIAVLKRLDDDVLVYRSLGDFEANGRLARVSFEAFTDDLSKVTAEVEPMLSRLPQSRLKSAISNALDSYRDGAFWWQKINQPRVVHVSALTATEFNRTPSDTAFLSTVPYTVAIHWRQAGKYLKRAEDLMDGTRK